MLRVEIRSDGIADLYGYQFTPGFDATSLGLISASESELFRRDGDSFWRQIPTTDAPSAPAAVAATRLGVRAAYRDPEA